MRVFFYFIIIFLFGCWWFFLIFISWSYFDLAHVMFISASILNTRARQQANVYTPFAYIYWWHFLPKNRIHLPLTIFFFLHFFAVAAIRAQIIGNDSFILIFRGPFEMLIIFQLLMNWLAKKRCNYLSICITFGGSRQIAC